MHISEQSDLNMQDTVYVLSSFQNKKVHER